MVVSREGPGAYPKAPYGSFSGKPTLSGFQGVNAGVGTETQSTTEATCALGNVTLVLDDPYGFNTNYAVQITSLDDTTNQMFGTITAISGSQITVAVNVANGNITSSNWDVLVIGSTNWGANASSALALDTVDTFTVPTIGTILNLTVDTGKAFNQFCSVYVASVEDYTSWFLATVTSYNSTTGALVLFVTSTSGVAGAYSLWAISLLSDTAIDSDLIAYATDTVTPAVGNNTWTTVTSGKFFPIQGQILIVDLVTVTNHYVGNVVAYQGNTLILSLTQNNIFGTQSSSNAWGFYLITGATTRISLYQMNGLLVTAPSGFSGTTTLTINPGSMRSSDDTVDLTLSQAQTLDLASTSDVVSLAGAGSISLGSGTAIIGSGTSFTTFFSATASNTDFNNQLTAAGKATITSPTIIAATNVAPSNPASETLVVTDDTHLTTRDQYTAYVGNYTRGGILSGVISTRIHYIIFLAMKDADGSVKAFAGSFTPSGTFDLPSGYTRTRAIALITVTTNGGSQFSYSVVQPLYTVPTLPGATPTAIWSGTITPTSVTGSVAGVNTATEVITWSTSHGLATGQSIRGIGTVPGGWTVGQMYYVGVLSTTSFSLYTTLANALADTSRVNLTSTTTGATIVVLVYSNVLSIGFNSIAPIAGTPGSTTMHWDFNLTNALASTSGVRLQCNAAGIKDSTPSTADFWIFTAQSGTTAHYSAPSTTLITYSGTIFSVGTSLNQGTWANQGTTAWTMECTIWG